MALMGADTDRGVGDKYRIHLGQLAGSDRYGAGILVPSLADQSHGHAGEAVRLRPDNPLAVDESDVRRSGFGDGGVGIDEQHVVEAIALRDAPALKSAEQSDVFDVRHIAAIDSRLQPQRRKCGMRGRSGGDQNVGFRVRTEASKFEGGIEHGHPDDHRPVDVDQRVTNEVSGSVGVQVGIEYPAAVMHQAFQVEGQTAYPLLVDSHRGVVTVVRHSKGLDLVRIGWNAVQLCHTTQSVPSGTLLGCGGTHRSAQRGPAGSRFTMFVSSCVVHLVRRCR